jgi:DNA-binding NtrC family response regulator
VKQGSFREDLYHRVYVFPLMLPPLRERREDIPVLAAHFARQVADQNSWKTKTFSAEAIEELENYAWPGNVRELRNVIERVLLLSTGDTIQAGDVRLALPQARPAGGTGDGTVASTSATGTLAERSAHFERGTILEELKRHGNHMTNTAKALGLERSHLYKKCQQLGIDVHAIRNSE